ncbi:MAG: L-rhamnose isomerase [Thermoflexales bacterium]|nr:L-rhamnose isomerase [Thermoflexales bacterium]
MSTHPSDTHIQDAYRLAKERYAQMGVDTDRAIDTLSAVALSLHCWQGDDVGGFENAGELTGGIAATGNYPGKARTATELRRDLDKVYSLLPGQHRLNLHAFYAETGGRKVDRNELQPEHFANWLDWAKANNHGLDFNPTCFSHPKAASGFTLASYDEGIRNFWIEHCVASRNIGAHFGCELGNTCVTNIWIPDGYKDTPVDRLKPRELLKDSLDKVFAERIDPRFNLDSIEGKLFGLGVESYTVGSHEFYLGYAATHQTLLTLDAGHYHPTESIADKISAALLFVPEILLHVSRGVRWDSDHVVILDDALQGIAQEIVRGGFLPRVHIGLDYFDASINRVAAWTIGARNTLRALLMALVEPIEKLRVIEQAGDFTQRLALLEELKGLPFGAVWDYHCLKHGVPVGMQYMDEIKAYERQELAQRG